MGRVERTTRNVPCLSSFFLSFLREAKHAPSPKTPAGPRLGRNEHFSRVRTPSSRIGRAQSRRLRREDEEGRAETASTALSSCSARENVRVWWSWAWRIEVPVSIRRRRGGCNVRSSLLSSRGAVRLCFSAIGGASSWVLDGTPRRDNSTRDYSWPEGLPDEGSCGERLAASSRCRACVVYAERVRTQRCGVSHTRSSGLLALDCIGRKLQLDGKQRLLIPTFSSPSWKPRLCLRFVPARCIMQTCLLSLSVCAAASSTPICWLCSSAACPRPMHSRGTFRMRGGERACSVSN
jgi:hypothetical protein